MRNYDMPTPFEEKTDNIINSLEEKSKASIGAIKSYSFWIVNILLLITVGFLSFVSADFSAQEQIKQVTLNTILITMCAYIAYLNSGSYGQTAARKSPEYVKAVTRYSHLKETIIAKGIMRNLGDYCSTWVQDDLDKARSTVLSEVGIDYGEYVAKEYSKLGVLQVLKLDLDRNAKKAIINANKIKPRYFAPTMLMTTSKQAKRTKRVLGVAPEIVGYGKDAISFIMTVLNMLITCVVVLSAVTEFSFVAVALCLVKVVLICYNIVTGYGKKYALVSINISDYVNQKSDHLEDFLKKCEKAEIN